MPEPSENFDPSRFVHPETGRVDDVDEFRRQVDVAIDSGATEPLLEYLADRIGDTDESEERILSAVLLDVVERGENNPDAVLYHASRLAERYERRDEHANAALCCGLVISVLSEKTRFRDAEPWLTRLRENIFRQSEDQSEEDSELGFHVGTMIRDALEFESAYFLNLAESGKARKVRDKVAEYLKNPASTSEEHILESTLAFIELDLGSPIRAKQLVSKAEEHASQTGDHADAAMYACRRANYTLMSMGRMGKGSAQSALGNAQEHLSNAHNVPIHPNFVEKAEEAYRGIREVVISL